MALRTFTTHPLVLRRVQVRRTEQITDRMRRIVVGGEELREIVVNDVAYRGFEAPGFDDHIKLIFASDGDLHRALPRQLEHGIEWTSAENRVTRDYTPRRVDLDKSEIDLDFVLHGDGPAVRWARTATAGDELYFVGPKSSLLLPEDLDWIALIADETGLPAVGRFLDDRPTDAPAHIVVLVEDESAVQDLTVRPGDTLEWRVAEPGDAEALSAAVRGVRLVAGQGYVWGAAESRALLPLRRYLQREIGLAKDRLNITGYWHREDTGSVDPRAADDVDTVRAPANPVAWLVTRAAIELGVIDALEAGPVPLEALAARLGVARTALGSLLPTLAASHIVVADAQSLRLGPAGVELLDEHVREEYSGPAADLVLALLHTAEGARRGVAPWQVGHAATFWDTARADAQLMAELVERGQRLTYLLEGFIADPVWNGTKMCMLAGPGLGPIQSALIDSGRRDVGLCILADPAEAAALRDYVEDATGLQWTPASADLAVLALALEPRTDDEAVQLLSEISRWASVGVVIEPGAPDALSAAATDEFAIAFARTGTTMRDARAIAALAERAGWAWTRQIELGWGVLAHVLIPAGSSEIHGIRGRA